MKGLILLTSIFQLAGLVNCWVIGVPHEIIDSCTKTVTNSSDMEVANLSNFEIYQENDTHAYMNGSIRYDADFDFFSGRVYFEHFDRGHWFITAFDRKYANFCESFVNPMDPQSILFSTFPGCPMKKGTVWTFDMVLIRYSEAALQATPSHWCGQWRATYIYYYHKDGKTLTNCQRYHGDVYEVSKRPSSSSKLVPSKLTGIGRN